MGFNFKDFQKQVRKYTEPKYVFNPAKLVYDEYKKKKEAQEARKGLQTGQSSVSPITDVVPQQVVTVPKPVANVPSTNELSTYQKRQGQVIINPFSQTIMIVSGMVLEETEPPALVSMPSIKQIINSGIAQLSNDLLTKNGTIAGGTVNVLVERTADGSDYYGPIRMNFDFSAVKAQSQIIVRGVAYAAKDLTTDDPTQFNFNFVAQPTSTHGIVLVIPFYRDPDGRNYAAMGKLYKQTLPVPIDRNIDIDINGPDEVAVVVTPITKVNLKQLLVNTPGLD